MTKYEIEFSYNLPEWGVIELTADSPEQAEEQAITEIEDIYPDIIDIQIDGVKEIAKD